MTLSSPINAGCFRDSAKALSAEWRLIVSEGESRAESWPEVLLPAVASKLPLPKASKLAKLLARGERVAPPTDSLQKAISFSGYAFPQLLVFAAVQKPFFD